jgi:hypothetical protein
VTSLLLTLLLAQPWMPYYSGDPRRYTVKYGSLTACSVSECSRWTGTNWACVAAGGGGSGLPADPSACSAGRFVTDQNASGVLTCAQVDYSNLSGTLPSHSHTDADIPNTITIDSAATCGTASLATDLDCAGCINPSVELGAAVGISEGGTGQASATAAFDALAPTTTQGDIIYHNGADNVRLPKGTGGQQLRMNAGATAPEWFTASAGTTIGYVEQVASLNAATTTDAATVYIGCALTAPTTTAAISRCYVPKAGSIKVAYLYARAGTAGTGEAWTCNVRLNNTTDTAIATVSSATQDRVWSNTGLNITVAVGDYIEFKCVQPTWATNPANVTYMGLFYVE